MLQCVRAVGVTNYICFISCLSGVADKNNVVNSWRGLNTLVNISSLSFKLTMAVGRRRFLTHSVAQEEKRAEGL